MMKESSSRSSVSVVNVSDINFEIYQEYVEKLRGSPFSFDSLLRSQHAACCSLLDLFTVLATALGPSVCQRAAERLQSRGPHSVSVGVTEAGAVSMSGSESESGAGRTELGAESGSMSGTVSGVGLGGGLGTGTEAVGVTWEVSGEVSVGVSVSPNSVVVDLTDQDEEDDQANDD